MRLFLVLMLTGCASQPAQDYVWRHDSGVQDQRLFNRDFGACQAQAMGVHPLTPVEQVQHLHFGCMAGKGWRLVAR